MRPSQLELMVDHVRAIHRAVTGSDPPAATATATPEGARGFPELVNQFAELEALARALPEIAERVPPFSFAPPLDVIGTERETIVELALPGVAREDIDVTLDGDRLIVAGARLELPPAEGRVYLHAELPRGPFRREIQLPTPVTGRPRVEVDNGIVRVRAARPSRSPLPQA
jgi:HSP20 family protein